MSDNSDNSVNVDTPQRTLLVATVLCIVCSVLVSTAAVSLRDRQRENQRLDIQKNILLAAQLLPDDGSDIDREQIARAFQRIETRQFKERAFYLVKGRDGGPATTAIIPIQGRGLWSTLYGFLALERDLRTVAGIGFYQHGETPGLGGEVDNPRWKASWRGKQIVDPQLRPELQVLKGVVNPDSPEAHRQIDGLSGATITSRGVQELVNRSLAQFLPAVRAEFAEEEGVKEEEHYGQ